METLSRISIFTEVVRHESFAGAARALGLTNSAVSKQIQALEAELKIRLLNRTTRRVSLTEEGAILFQRARPALEDIREVLNEIRDLKDAPRGPLRISAPMTFGRQYLTVPIAAFASAYPEVHLDVQFDDRLVDLTQEGVDVAIRIGVPEDSTMIARKLADCPFCVCASPGYLERYGEPAVPEDLAKHNVLAYTRNGGAHDWRYKDRDGAARSVLLRSNFRCDTAEMMVEAARQGIGLVVLPRFFVNDDLASGRLTPVLSRWQSWPERSLYALFPQNRYLSTRVRLFLDHMKAHCDAAFGRALETV